MEAPGIPGSALETVSTQIHSCAGIKVRADHLHSPQHVDAAVSPVTRDRVEVLAVPGEPDLGHHLCRGRDLLNIETSGNLTRPPDLGLRGRDLLNIETSGNLARPPDLGLQGEEPPEY